MAGILFSFGHGYTAEALGRTLLAQGWRVIGTTRSEQRAKALRQSRVEALVWPGGSLAPLSEATHVLVSAGPSEAGDPVLNEAREALAPRAGGLDWLGYLSTTGVYGDRDGGWVDEETPLAPSTRRGRQRVAAETAWRDFAAETGAPLHVFRLAGIYGPGRGPFSKVRKGGARRIVKPGQVFSRIHVEDIAQVLRASMERPRQGAVYNLCDDDPAPPQDVVGYAADLLGQERPPEIAFADADLSPMARSFYAENKRVRNDRIKTELGVTLRYPTYREGLRALLEAERG